MTRKGLLLFASMCVIWGIPYFLIRVAVGEISPVMLVFARTGIGALILMPIVIARGGLRGLGRKWVPILAFAAVEIGGPWFCLSSAEQRISSSLAGLLVSCVPLVGIAGRAALRKPGKDRTRGYRRSGLGWSGLRPSSVSIFTPPTLPRSWRWRWWRSAMPSDPRFSDAT